MTRRDVAPPTRRKIVKPGALRKGRIAIFDRAGNRRGTCGPKMTEASMPRFGLKRGAEFRNGGWHGK